MPNFFSHIELGKRYDRPALAKLWGYKSHHAISKGVVIPKSEKVIILFVTRVKQNCFPDYKDHLYDDFLYWEGESKNGSDLRIVKAKQDGYAIHLFYREIHHSPFFYRGEVSLVSYDLKENEPSSFTFRLGSECLEEPKSDFDYFGQIASTERETVVRSRLGQGRFRQEVCRLWESCSVTGVKNPSLLRASHIKPWRVCSNSERLDPHNGLLLLPQYDHLFDQGLITFSGLGELILSPALRTERLENIGIHEHARLRFVKPEIDLYLQYHRSEVFVSRN